MPNRKRAFIPERTLGIKKKKKRESQRKAVGNTANTTIFILIKVKETFKKRSIM